MRILLWTGGFHPSFVSVLILSDDGTATGVRLDGTLAPPIQADALASNRDPAKWTEVSIADDGGQAR